MTEIVAIPTKPINHTKVPQTLSQADLQQVQEKLAQIGELGQTGELDKAQALCEEVLRLMPTNPQATYFLGLIALQRQQLDTAITQFEKALPAMPVSAELQLHLGVAYGQKGHIDKAIATIKRALQLNNKFGEAHYNLGLLLLRKGDVLGAQTHYQRAVELTPDNPAIQVALGNLYQLQHQIPKALAAYAHALKLQPHFPECYFYQAGALEKEGRAQQALESYYKALELNPSYGEALNHAGMLLMRINQYEPALQHFKTIVTQIPNYLPAIKNYGDALNATKQYSEAANVFKQGLETHPDSVELLSGYYIALRNDCVWSTLENVRNTMLEKAKIRITQNLPVGIHPHLALSLGLDAQTEYSIAKNHAHFAFQYFPRNQFDFSKRDKDTKLKVGYVLAKSQDALLAHIADVVTAHDRQKFAITVYGVSTEETPALKAVMSAADQFIDLSYSTATEMAQRIYQDEIDILVDLMGYLPGAHPEVLVAKPAPIQMSYLGYRGTMGGNFVDYYLGDAITTPSEFEAFYTEKLLRLPQICTSDKSNYTNIQVSTKAECGLPENKFVFCSSCTVDNMEPKVFGAWLKILTQVSDSVLWLFDSTEPFAARLHQFAQQNKIDPSRLIFANESQAIGQYHHADLFLDTLIYNADSAIDALGMNVPVLSVLGETTATRTSASFLTALDLEELIATDVKDYVQKAVDLAQRPSELAMFKQKLTNHKANHSLFNAAQFTRDLEVQYQKAWQ